ncbi:uncharacterized protein PODANS_2_7710 [Podospora anserina S mat+]|uniref:Podospora anserina S mat+ genomic DNA chromosome 2, supercontig 2 n=1 Tax=Podospora anserina (strain S / ATCC MYA-4624 / DSM 980 / FGSC 10383) TaxID=515849 RepID=B2B6G2_PODAN|nr:uncharacterized protein PODANS_2_7710 [Podospora anserina S mat+]CAP73387.1 unnamed protein product [Podospora anserina S mat+]CDP25790.1 Putative protein of unknown function [Podospora anserina S mat+]
MAQFRLSRFDDSGDEEQPTFSTNTLQGSGGAIKQSTVLEAAKAVDFSKPDQSVAFEKKYREFLNTANNERTSTSGNILHKLADKSEDDWWQDKHEGEAGDGRSFLRWLLKNYEHMLKCEYKKDDSIPLHFALYHENHAFVKIALDGLEPEDSEIAPSSTLGQILQHRNRDDETCLYLAVKHNSEHVNRIIKLCARIGNEAGGVRRSNVFAQQSLADKSTALHHAVMLRQEETLAINFVTDPPLATIVNESMKADMRLELISLQVVNKSPVDEKRLEMVKLLMESEFIQNTASNVRAILARMNYSEDKDKKHNKALNLTPFQTRVEGLVSRIWKAYRAHATTEFRGLPGPIKDKLKKTAREQALQTALAEVYGTDEILTMMKLFCIDKFRTNRKNLLQALYAPGEERHLEFSLSGLRGQTLTKDYLKRLVKHLKFESILICVSLPSLIFETDPVENGFPISQANSNARSGANYAGERRSEAVVANAKTNEAMMNGKGRRDLVSVFQWLRENHVRTIKRVVVIDDSDRPHSDGAIEQALMNLDVEIWDWKKPDICSDVIYSVAPNVREVSLYWSGNAATMLGWYSNEGFANREKFRKVCCP